MPFAADCWPPATLHADSWFSNWQEGDSDWRVLRRDVLLRQWPTSGRWPQCVRETLESLVEAGACVAWCVTEGRSADPPDAFDPEGMKGAIWAVYGKNLEFSCTVRLGEPYESVSDETLLAFQAAALQC